MHVIALDVVNGVTLWQNVIVIALQLLRFLMKGIGRDVGVSHIVVVMDEGTSSRAGY